MISGVGLPSPQQCDAAWGRVVNTYEKDGLGVVECETGIRNDSGLESTPGSAVIILPIKTGKAVPYPFASLES